METKQMWGFVRTIFSYRLPKQQYSKMLCQGSQGAFKPNFQLKGTFSIYDLLKFVVTNFVCLLFDFSDFTGIKNSHPHFYMPNRPNNVHMHKKIHRQTESSPAWQNCFTCVKKIHMHYMKFTRMTKIFHMHYKNFTYMRISDVVQLYSLRDRFCGKMS